MIIFSPISRRLEIGHIFGTGGYKCLLWMCSGRKTNPSTYIFEGNSNSYYINILFNSRNITIKAHLAMSVGLPEQIKPGWFHCHTSYLPLRHWHSKLCFLTPQPFCCSCYPDIFVSKLTSSGHSPWHTCR